MDKSIVPVMGTFKPTGVNPRRLVTRKALDREGFSHVRIVASGALTQSVLRPLKRRRSC